LQEDLNKVKEMNLLMLFLVAGVMTLGLAPQAGAQTFNFTEDAGETLVWQEDFNDNVNGWSFVSGTAISDLARIGQTDGGGTCGAPAAGAMAGFLHLDEDDGTDGHGFQLGGIATVDLTTPIDLSGGPMTLYMAFHTPSNPAPRLSVKLDNSQSGGASNITFSYMQGFRIQTMVNETGIPGCCGAKLDCGTGGASGLCPNGHDADTCTPLEFLLRFDATGNALLRELNLAGNPGTWRDVGSHSGQVNPTLMDQIYVYMESDGSGGNRIEALAGTQGSGLTPPEVGGFQFDLEGSDVLSWNEDFDNNDNGWVFVNSTAISNPSISGQTDAGTLCGTSAPGAMVGFLHLNENDGQNSFSGPGAGGVATIDLSTPIDLSGGPMTLYMAFHTPTGASPRTAVRLQNKGSLGPPLTDNISFEWLQAFRAQIFFNSDGPPGCCGTPDGFQCGNLLDPPNLCPNAPLANTCNPLQFLLRFDAAGNVTLRERSLSSNPGIWRDMISVSGSGHPTILDQVLVYLESDFLGGQRLEAVAGTLGELPGSTPPINAVESFRLYRE
jgi:hypothetical protein